MRAFSSPISIPRFDPCLFPHSRKRTASKLFEKFAGAFQSYYSRMPASRSLTLFLNLGHTFDHLLMLIFPTVVLAMSAELGRGYSELLPLALGGFICFGAFSIPAGWLADRWSRFGMMVVFFFGIGTAAVLTGLARGPVEIALGLTLIGVFAAIYHPVGITMLVANQPNVGRALGVNGVFGNVGVAFSALMAGALAEAISWRAAFIVPGLLALAVGAAFAFGARDPGKANCGAQAGAAPAVARGTRASIPDPDRRHGMRRRDLQRHDHRHAQGIR